MTLESRLRGCEVELSTIDGRVRGTVAGVIMEPGGTTLSAVAAVDLTEVWDMSLNAHVHGMQRFDYTEDFVFEEIKWRPGEEPKEEDFRPQKMEQLAQLDAIISVDVPYVILDSIGVTEFLVAVEHVRRQKVVGFSLAGSRLGRRGRLSWVVVSTPTLTYLFDVFSLGNEGFKHGLKEICTSVSIVKVTHDCRCAADMLRRQYNIDLANVFDVQVADMMVEARKMREGNQVDAKSKWPKTVLSLTACCEKYLRVGDPFEEKVDYQRLNSDTWWFLRPPHDDHLRFMMKGTVYLLPLKEALEEKLSVEYRCAFEAYLGSVRELEDISWTETSVGTVLSFRPPDDFDDRYARATTERHEREAGEKQRPIQKQQLRMERVDGFKLKERLENEGSRERGAGQNLCVTSRATRKKIRLPEKATDAVQPMKAVNQPPNFPDEMPPLESSEVSFFPGYWI